MQSLKDFWNVLQIRQLCKVYERMILALKSDEGKLYFALENDQMVKLLWDIEVPLERPEQEDDFLPFEAEALQIGEDIIDPLDEELWATNYSESFDNKKRHVNDYEFISDTGKWEIQPVYDEDSMEEDLNIKKIRPGW
jgi:hypothetical protein